MFPTLFLVIYIGLIGKQVIFVETLIVNNQVTLIRDTELRTVETKILVTEMKIRKCSMVSGLHTKAMHS